MTLLNYIYHAAPTSHKDVLSKFRTFAVVRGWSNDEYQTSVDWASGGWVAGTSDFLQLSTNAYGTQDVIARFFFEGTGADALSENCYIKGVKPGFGTYDTATTTNPYLQDVYNNYGNIGNMGLPSGSHIGCWFFGNDKILMAVDQVTTTFCIFWWCGSIEMFDTSQDCFVCFSGAVSTALIKYYNADTQSGYWIPPWMDVATISAGGPYWWDGSGRSSTDIKRSSGFTHADTVSGGCSFTKLANVVTANTFSGRRVLIKPTIFGKISSTGLWHPAGTLPLYHMVYSGLSIGEEIAYGSENYIVFPNCFQTRKYGTAFRIA